MKVINYAQGSAKEQIAKRVISTIMKRGGYNSNAQSYNHDWFDISHVKWLMDEFIDRTGDHVANLDVDRAIADLSDKRWWNKPFAKLTKQGQEKIIEILAWFCQQSGLQWDITNWDANKMAEVQKTIWWKAMETYGLYIDENAPAQSSQDQTATSASVSSSNPNAGTGTKKGEGKYAQSGKHSDKVPFLIGQPGQKIYLNGIRVAKKNNRILSVIADPQAAKKKVLYINPIDYNPNTDTATSGSSQVRLGGVPHYGWGSILYFEDSNSATAVAKKAEQKYGVQLYLTHSLVDKNGYFKVMTEFGEAYIKADRLNEDIDLSQRDVITESTEITQNKTFDEVYAEEMKDCDIGDANLFAECFNR